MNKTNTHNVSLGTLYDFNKQIIVQQKKLNKTQIKKIELELEEWFNWQLDAYAMLLCRERHDYTIFHLYEKGGNINPPAIAVKELIETLNNRGEILSIEKTKDKNWEIWIKINKEAFVYYLFNCDDFIIEC